MTVEGRVQSDDERQRALRVALLLSLNEGVGARLITREKALDVIEAWDARMTAPARVLP